MFVIIYQINGLCKLLRKRVNEMNAEDHLREAKRLYQKAKVIHPNGRGITT